MSKAIVTIEKVYSDGSGAPALVHYQGWLFAAHYTSGAHLTLLGNGCGRPSKRVVVGAQHAYEQALRLCAPAGWYELNRQMYAT